MTTIAILAGGASRRMGVDKAALILQGRTLLDRAIDVALAVSPNVLVVGGEAGRRRAGDEDAGRPESGPHAEVRFVADDLPGQGPLGGLVTALRHSGTSVLAIACDMPWLTSEALRWLIELDGEIHADAPQLGTVTTWHGQLEPLFSIYRPACLPLMEARLARGERALHRFIQASGFRTLDVPAWVGEQLANVNTPEAWEAARRRVTPASSVQSTGTTE